MCCKLVLRCLIKLYVNYCHNSVRVLITDITSFIVLASKVLFPQREPGWDKESAWLYNRMGLLDFNTIYKILFAVHLKHPIFGPPADVKPM
jgi:hypothetical protein